MKEKIMKRFLRKLINNETWGGKHTPLLKLTKVIPTHLRGDKAAKEAIKELVKREFILVKMSTNELHVSLNTQKKMEIYSFMKTSQL